MNISNWRYAPKVSGVLAGLDTLFGGKGKEKEPHQGRLVDTDTDGEPLFQEDIIRFLQEELERRKMERLPLEQQWTLNANFIAGNQYCERNPYRGYIEQLEPVYDWLEREAFNRIAPLIETRKANLKKINYTMTVKPRTNELDDYYKADVSTAILRHTQNVTDFNTKKNTMIAWNELCGNCFWLCWWDKNKGNEYARMAETVIGTDGVQEQREEAFYDGDLDYGLLTPYEVYPESVFKQTVTAQRSIIIEQVKTVDDVYDLYGIKTEGSEVETFALTPMPTGGGYGYENTVTTIGHRTTQNAVKVVTYFERPSRHRPDGRLIILVGEDHLVYYGGLPYKRIPIEQVVCKEVEGQFFGRSVIEELIPLQRAFNGCVNRIHEYIKRVAIQNYALEEGAVIDIEEYEQNGVAPGAILVYSRGSEPPQPLPNGNIPSEIMTERYNLTRDMEYVAGVSQLMVNGATPTGVTSGTAIENLREIDNTRLSLTGDHIRNSVKNLAVLWLEIFKQYATTRRAMLYTGTNEMASCIVWSQEDINSYDVEFTTENELILSEEVQKQLFFDAYNMGAFTERDGTIPQRVKQKILEYSKVGNYSELMGINDLQMQNAQRENGFFENGILPEVSEYDDHEIHVEEHLRYILQMKFRILKYKKPDYAAAMEAHLREHQQALAAIEQQQMEAVQQLQEGGN